MPELPEVETIKLGIQKYLVGHTITDVDIKLPQVFQGEKKNVVGAKITEARRVGKGLIIELSNGYCLAIHIKLTGQLIYRGQETKNVQVSKTKVGTTPNKFTHVIFHLDKGGTLYYNDQRRFGWIKVVKTAEVMELPFFKTMGPEPFKDLTEEKFKQILSKSALPVKVLIMEQKRIGGIGNIYANDALYLAGIHPKRKAKDVTEKEAGELFKAIIAVMEKSFKYGGASELTFVNLLGQEGEYQRHSLVYGKKGGRCKNCGGEITKFYLGGRGTFVCENCQF